MTRMPRSAKAAALTAALAALALSGLPSCFVRAGSDGEAVKGAGTGGRRVVPAPGTTAPGTAVQRAPVAPPPPELIQAYEQILQGQKLLSEAGRRVEEELELKVFDEARGAYQKCLDLLEGLFRRLPAARQLASPAGRTTANGMQLTCRRRITRVIAESSAAQQSLKPRHVARLQQLVETLPRLRSDAADARKALRSRSPEADRELSAAIDAHGRAVARLDHAFRAYPDVAEVRPKSGARTYARLREALAAEATALGRERAKLRGAGDTVRLAKLKRSMRGLSKDQRRIVEEHLALPDLRKKRKGGGVCFIYRKPVVAGPASSRAADAEETCFDRTGKLVGIVDAQ
jgi:hypothetical protein